MDPFAAPRVPARPRSRRRLGPWAVALLVMALAGSVFAAAHSSPSLTSGRGTVPAGPRAVVLAYVAAINRHDWHRVWALGGKNLDRSYRAMVAGYRLTAHDDVTGLRVRGDTVYVHLLSHQTTGAVQSYRIRYVIHDGIIIAGHSLPPGTN